MHLETRTITDFLIFSATTKPETSFRQLMSGKSTGKKPSKMVIQRKSRGAKNAPSTRDKNDPGTGGENAPTAPEITGGENDLTFYNLSISSPGGGCLEAEAEV